MKKKIPSPLDKISAPLLKWFDARARSLPWREDPRPYYVWVSEIMLQQTRVAAVMPYFTRFIEALPDIKALAAVNDDVLMKLWEGLGYYSRARNLKKAAQVIMEKYEGAVPQEYESLLSLPGVGRYTAGAVCSIAYGKRVPAVDGNVLRVVSRLAVFREDVLREKTRRMVEDYLLAVMPKEAGQFNQAMMELGALVCLPRTAHCEECPLVSLCLAHAKHIENELPVKSPKKARRIEQRTVFLMERDGCFAITKRPKQGLLAGMWEFPNFPGEKKREEVLALCKEAGFSVRNVRRMKSARHIFTHIEWLMTGWHIYIEDISRERLFENRAAYGSNLLPPLIWANEESLSTDYSIPTAFHAYLPGASKS